MKLEYRERIEVPVAQVPRMLTMDQAVDRLFDAIQYREPQQGGGHVHKMAVSDYTMLRLAVRLLEESGCIDYFKVCEIEDLIRAGYRKATKKSPGKRETDWNATIATVQRG